VFYTTNAIQSLNMQLRKIIKNRDHFPIDDAAIKLLWLALRNVMQKAERMTLDWRSAMNEFAIQFDGRLAMNRT
jgi:putative transposase